MQFKPNSSQTIQVAIRFSTLTNVDAEKKSIESVIARFFGLFFMINQTSTIWGNLISSTGNKHPVVFF